LLVLIQVGVILGVMGSSLGRKRGSKPLTR
jgi:hypothetical protein